MRKICLLLALPCIACPARARDPSDSGSPRDAVSPAVEDLTRRHDYVVKRSSSYDRSGGNADARAVAPGETLTLLDVAGPGVVTHLWATVASPEPYHLKKLVLRMFWDDEETPSVEAPLGDFFGLGLGDYVTWQSTPLAVAPDKALNSFFAMPFQRHAKIVVENQGSERVRAFYFNVDYRVHPAPLPADTLYFHAQYRQCAPCAPVLGNGKNTTGDDNYVFLSATGQGHFAGVTLSVVENTDGWWGEGDDMFFVDGERVPSVQGTGTEDYFLGAWDFGGKPFQCGSFGAPVVGAERAGERWSLYRFHLDAPITFTRSLRATIEHGHANDRADDYSSVAYWYQTEPHAPFPALPAVDDRLPRAARTRR